MGRGHVSKSVRAQNRANAAGHPTRGNPWAGWHGQGTHRRRQVKQRDWERNDIQKYLIHDNKHYRVAYRFDLDDGNIVILGAVHYPNPKATDAYKGVYDMDLLNKLAHRLLITLAIEEARKNQ